MTEVEIVEKYDIKGELAKSGHEGVRVLRASRLQDQLDVVIKCYSKVEVFGEDSARQLAWREETEQLLLMPKSESICELMEMIETEENYYVVMEMVAGNDLRRHMDCSPAVAREVMRQLLQAVQTLHASDRIHRDIKLDNFVVHVGEAGEVLGKLVDFDTVAEWQEGSPRATEVIGSPGYIAQEAYLGHYSPASDMFAVGVIMYKLLAKRFPVSPLTLISMGDSRVGSPAQIRSHNRIKHARIDFSLTEFAASPPAAAICRALLSRDPEKRPTAEQALGHEWFAVAVGGRVLDTRTFRDGDSFEGRR